MINTEMDTSPLPVKIELRHAISLLKQGKTLEALKKFEYLQNEMNAQQHSDLSIADRKKDREAFGHIQVVRNDLMLDSARTGVASFHSILIDSYSYERDIYAISYYPL